MSIKNFIKRPFLGYFIEIFSAKDGIIINITIQSCIMRQKCTIIPLKAECHSGNDSGAVRENRHPDKMQDFDRDYSYCEKIKRRNENENSAVH